MQDFVRIGIADAAEQVGVSQRTFQRMVFESEPRCERGRVCLHHVDAARIERGRGIRAANKVQRGTATGAGLGERERAALELEHGERDACRRPCVALQPAQAPGDHQMQD